MNTVSLWFLNHYSTVSVILIFCGSVTLLALLASVVIRRAVPRLAERNYEEKISVVRDLFGLLYFLIVAFGITEISGRFSFAEEKVDAEANSVAQLVSNTTAFPPEAQLRIKDAVAYYLHAVVDDEFVLMKNGEESPIVAVALGNLYGVFVDYEPKTTREELFYESSIGLLNEIDSNRRERLAESSGPAIPELLGLFNLGGLFVFLALSYPASISNERTQLVVVGILAALVSFGFLLTIVLDYPFSGEISVSTDPYKSAILTQFFLSR